MFGDDADGRHDIRRMKRLSGELSTIAQSLLQYRSEQFLQTPPSTPQAKSKMPILTEKNLNAFNVNRHEPSADKSAYRKEDYTSKQENQKPSYPKIKTEDLKLDEKTLKYDPTVKDEEKAEPIDDDEGDKTVIVSKKGEKLDDACSCGKKEEDGKVEDVVEKGDDGVDASVEKKLEEALREPDAEKKEEADEAKTDEKADAAPEAEEKVEVKGAEKDVKSEETKEAKKEK